MHLGIIGYGNIAESLTKLLESQPVEKITVLVRTTALERARTKLQSSKAANTIEVTTDLADVLSAKPDLVIECAGHSAVEDLGPRILGSGITLLLVSIGALATYEVMAKLRQAADDGDATLVLPAGAIGGIDLLAALAPMGDLKVCYRGTKPPAAWKGTPASDLLDLNTLSGPNVFFSGTARQAAREYPKNANVAATLALAGAGFDETAVDLVADPAATGNQHAYEVISPVCRYSIEIENTASGANSKTSVTTIYSVLREINRFRNPVVI